MFLIEISAFLMNSLKEQICGHIFSPNRESIFITETKIFRRGPRYKGNRENYVIHKRIQTVRSQE